MRKLAESWRGATRSRKKGKERRIESTTAVDAGGGMGVVQAFACASIIHVIGDLATIDTKLPKLNVVGSIPIARSTFP